MNSEQKYELLLQAMRDIAYCNLPNDEDGFAEDEYIFAQRILVLIGEAQ